MNRPYPAAMPKPLTMPDDERQMVNVESLSASSASVASLLSRRHLLDNRISHAFQRIREKMRERDVSRTELLDNLDKVKRKLARERHR